MPSFTRVLSLPCTAVKLTPEAVSDISFAYSSAPASRHEKVCMGQPARSIMKSDHPSSAFTMPRLHIVKSFAFAAA